MPHRRKAILARLIVFAALCLSGCSFLSTPIDLSGGWQGHLEWTSGPVGIQSPIALDLVHDGRHLSGTITLMGPGSTSFDLQIEEGTARYPSLSLRAAGVLPIDPPQQVLVDLEGDFDASRMSGTGTQTVNGTTYTLVWEAVLVAPAVPEA